MVFSGLRSRNGAGFKLLTLLDEGRFEIALSVPLVFEYEDVLARHVEAGLFQPSEIAAFLDYLCAIAHRQDIFFLWRPYLPGSQDDQLLELAVAAGCDGIVTYDERDFAGSEKLGVRIYVPRTFLRLLEKSR